jgi:hypothetical protein
VRGSRGRFCREVPEGFRGLSAGPGEIHAVTIETDEGIYLVKIKVKTDNAEALERWLEGEEDAENEEVAGTSGVSDGSTLPDDNISQYSSGDDAEGDA